MARRRVVLTNAVWIGVLLLLSVGMLTAMAAPGSVTALPVVVDFESGIPSTLGVFNDSGSSVQLALDTQPLPTVPGAANNATAIVTYTIASGGYGGITQPFIDAQDWTGYQAFGFWLYGSNSGLNHRIELKSQGANAGASNLWQYSFADDFTGWKFFMVPFSDFVKRTDYNPGAGLGDSIDLTVMWGWSLLLEPNTAGTLWLDNVSVFKATTLFDFQAGIPAGFGAFADSWDGSGSSTALSLAHAAVMEPRVPAVADNMGVAVTYTIAASGGWGGGPGYGGVTHPFTQSQDWSGNFAFGFWMRGSNSGLNHRIELKSQGPNAGASNLWQYTFADNFSGWKHFMVPFADFVKRTDYNPGAALGDSIDLSVMWGYSLLLEPGSAGVFYLDDVALFGDLTTLQATYAERTLSVDEGNPVTLTVNLNMVSANPVSVDYTTVDDVAVAGSDFVAANGTLNIPAGFLSASFVVNTIDDAEVEGGETFLVVLSNPVSVSLTSQVTATVTIKDNDQAPPVVGGHSVIVDDFEMATLPTGADSNGNPVGFVTWNAPGASAGMGLVAPANQVPGKPAGNQVMQLDLNLGAGQWGGFTHAFGNAAGDTWVSQDWSAYEGVSFWLYGNNSGSVIFVDIMDNRTPGSTTDDAERWSKDIPDDFTGWQFFQIPFSEFNRKDISNGAPFDGFGKNEVWGYAIGGFNTIANQSYFVDDFGLMPRTTIVDDFEMATLPTGADSNGNPVGFVTWNAPGASAGMGLAAPANQVPGKPAGNQALQLDLNLGAGQWGGFTHTFGNAAGDTWVSQNWSTYEGICFWLYGNNSGSVIFVDILDNRTPGSTTDDAERWSKDIPDDFTGWQFFQIPFSEFNRKDISNGAPFDGFGKNEVWGYAIGGFNTIANQSYFVDDVTIYGNVGGGAGSVQVAFNAATYPVDEGATAAMTVSLNMTSTTPVTVTYASMESRATPDRDFTPVSGTLTFAPGVTAQVISVPTLDDTKHEGDEGVMVNLYDPQGADFAFQRRALLTIVDNDAADPQLLDDFEDAHGFAGAGVALSRTELVTGTANALPGQGAFEHVLTVQYDNAARAANHFARTFTTPQNWSSYAGVSFWYYGNNSGDIIKYDLLDNQVITTQGQAPAEWVLRWADEFNETAGTPPNPNNWKYEIGDGTLNGNPGWGNSEFQFYSSDPANAAADGAGNLIIGMTAVNTATTDLLCYYGPCRYTSARLITQDRAHFKYGKIEARMKLPPTDQSGLWPAFWALGDNITTVGWPQSGEIDVMEYVSRVPDEIFGTLHGPGYSGSASFGDTIHIPNLTDDYHTYTVEWTENHIVWYADGVKFHEARDTSPFLTGKEWVYNHPFFLLLNVAIGGNFGGAVSDQLTFPQNTLVDYVRVYQAADTAERFEASFVDDYVGWKKVAIPFSAFTRSVVQPAGAPNDGLTLTAVNGYGLTFPSSGGAGVQAIITTHIDQVRAETQIDTPTALDDVNEPMQVRVFIPTVRR